MNTRFLARADDVEACPDEAGRLEDSPPPLPLQRRQRGRWGCHLDGATEVDWWSSVPGAVLGGLSLNVVPFLSQALKVSVIGFGKCGPSDGRRIVEPLTDNYRRVSADIFGLWLELGQCAAIPQCAILPPFHHSSCSSFTCHQGSIMYSMHSAAQAGRHDGEACARRRQGRQTAGGAAGQHPKAPAEGSAYALSSLHSF